MIIALGVMFVTGLLLVAAFTAAHGDVEASHENVTDKQAYYAALAGMQQYEYKLEANPSYWETCEPLEQHRARRIERALRSHAAAGGSQAFRAARRTRSKR